MHTTDLGGHSGCKILLCETNDDNVFVRKIASDISYNERLMIQAEKQSKFTSNTLKAPAVLGHGETEGGLFYFDMEYISGITLAEYMNSIEVGKVRNIVRAIVKDIVSLSNNSLCTNEKIFYDKIRSLEEILEQYDNPVIKEALAILKNHSWARFATSRCHGDLTLENIIVKDNELYLIDFLDSFYDNWILDVGTLMQDVQTLWSYRYENEININTLIRLVVFRDILMDTVCEISKEYWSEVHYALLLKLIRVYPYVKDEKTYTFLNEKTLLIIERIKQEKMI